jgi:hypothetical protein
VIFVFTRRYSRRLLGLPLRERVTVFHVTKYLGRWARICMNV